MQTEVRSGNTAPHQSTVWMRLHELRKTHVIPVSRARAQERDIGYREEHVGPRLIGNRPPVGVFVDFVKVRAHGGPLRQRVIIGKRGAFVVVEGLRRTGGEYRGASSSQVTTPGHNVQVTPPVVGTGEVLVGDETWSSEV